MAVITLSFIGSDEEITSGIPQFMTIESSVPSTIFFTLDGTTPTTNSPMYVDTFAMPDGEDSVVLSAFGVDSDGYTSPILTQTFSADFSKLDRTHHLFNEGIRVDDYADPFNLEIGYDADLDPVYSDLSDINLRTLRSDKGRLGIADGTVIEILTPEPSDTPFPFDDQFQISSSPSDEMFNPYAKTIVNDYREDNVIQILNRPFGSMRAVSREDWGQSEIRSTDSSYISGGFVRRFYNSKTNTMGSYYYDNNTNRWVLGLQDLPDNIPNVFNWNYSSQPLVFQWIPYGRHSSIPI